MSSKILPTIATPPSHECLHLTLRSFTEPPDIVVIVGPERQHFYLHKVALTEVSPFFTAALDGDFKESKSQTITLPEDPVSAFKPFVKWVYFGQELDKTRPDHAWQLTDRINIALDVFVFGDKIGCSEFRDLGTKNLQWIFENNEVPPPSQEIVERVYSPTFPSRPQTSTVRDCVVRIVAKHLNRYDIREDRQLSLELREKVMGFPPEFVTGLVDSWIEHHDIYYYYRGRNASSKPKPKEKPKDEQPEKLDWMPWIKSLWSSWAQSSRFYYHIEFGRTAIDINSGGGQNEECQNQDDEVSGNTW